MERRGFRESDYEAVCAFLVELNRGDRTHVNWNWARFEWMYEHPEFDRSCLSAMGLWWDGDRIAGAAIYDMYFGEAFCGALPGYSGLYPEILDYACAALGDEAGLGIAICDNCPEEIAAARAGGFQPEEQSETILGLGLETLGRRSMPEGYTVRTLDPAREAETFQWLLWQGFDHGTDPAVFAREDPVIPQRRPHLNPKLSLTALAPGGEPAAYCCLWYLPGTDYAYVEPVCTVPAHRGRGVAGGLLSEALARAKALGAKEAFVISDQDFYQKLGFVQKHHYTFYRRPR